MATSPETSTLTPDKHASRWVGVILALAGLFHAPAHVSAGPLIPPDAAAFYRLDPQGFDPAAAAVLPFALRLAERNGLIEKDFHPIFDAILVASTAGAVPHSLCVLDLDAEYDEAAENGFRITRLQAVLVLETPRDHRSYLQTLGTILSHYREAGENEGGGGGGGGGEEIEKLPGGVSVARFQAADWEDWRAVEWASLPDSFVVGIGRGSIGKWVATQQTASDQTFITRHRDQLSQSNGANTGRFLEIWLNLDRLHETMPDVLAQGRVRSVLTAWKLDGARNWMLHGRWHNRYLLADLTWQRRSESRAIIAHRALTLDHWPDDLKLPEPPGKYVAVFPANLAGVMDRILDVYGATQQDARKEKFEKTRQQYDAKYRRTFRYLFDGFRPYIVLSNYPAPPLAIPGATTVYLELKGRLSPQKANPRIQALIEHFIPPKKSKKKGEPPRRPIHFDEATRIYWYEADSNGLIHLPVWGWSQKNLILGWGVTVVSENRDWLEQDR